MKTVETTMTIYKTFDDGTFHNKADAKAHERRLLNRYAGVVPLRKLVDYMRKTDDVAGLSYVTRILARMDGFSAEM